MNKILSLYDNKTILFISFGYQNSEIFKLLKKRGEVIKQIEPNLTKQREIENHINTLKNSPFCC